MSNVIEAKDIFAQGGSVADLRLLCCPEIGRASCRERV